jgi:hypothetical protein
VQVRFADSIPRDDALAPPPPGAPDVARYSEWHHFNFNDDAAGVYGICNLALSGNVYEPAQARAGLSLVVCERGRGWHGTMNLYPVEDARFAGGSLDLAIGTNAVRFHRGRYEVHGALKDNSLAVHATWAPRTAAMRIDRIGGMLSSFVLPRHDVRGTLTLGGREIHLTSATGYHDHNWGCWDWGRDIGWDWGYILQPNTRRRNGSGPLSIVFGQVTDGTRTTAKSDLVVIVWRGEQCQQVFMDDAVAISTEGELRSADIPRVPGVMSLLAPDRPHVPSVVRIRVADGDDQLDITLRVEAAMQFLIPHPATLGRTTISELVGEYTVRGALCGRDVDFAYTGFAELAG